MLSEEMKEGNKQQVELQQMDGEQRTQQLFSRAWNEMQKELPRNGKPLCIEELLREKIFALLRQEEMQGTMEPLQLSIVAA